jgi:uncharacterized membrane protein YfcA
MGFGPTSSSILLGSGLSPAAAATTVNVAKVATGIAAAISHWRFRNIDRTLVLKLALPGATGAIVGVTVLSNVDGATLRPLLAALLLLIGLRILSRFSRPVESAASGDADGHGMPAFDDRGVELVAVAGGVTNGMIGAWGPVVTPFLMHRRVEPRYAVGSVNTAEVAVAAVSATSLITALGRGQLDLAVVGAMLLGGVLAAPVAAWLVRRMSPRPMGVAVAGLLLVTNVRELASWAGLGAGTWLAYGAVVLLVGAAALRPRAARRVADLRGPQPAVAG